MPLGINQQIVLTLEVQEFSLVLKQPLLFNLHIIQLGSLLTCHTVVLNTKIKTISIQT
jgi:hypothetical protein